MKNKKNGIVLIYVLFLVTLSVVFATILVNNNSYLFNIARYFDVDSKLYSNIESDGNILVGINKEVNSNGNGFVDNISCPSSNIIMSGTTLTNNIGSILVNSGSIYCEGIYFGKSLKLFFNTGFTDIDLAEYENTLVGITSGIGNSTFGDSDSTSIDFSGYNINTGDGIDDDFNSDNYMVTSTGNTATGIYYSNSYEDDDILGRKTLFGYVSYEFGYKKVFWNTSKVVKIIDDNTNNNDNINTKIGGASDGILHFDVDKQFDIRVVKFDKNIYNKTNELITLGMVESQINAGIGYLQVNGGVLSLSNTKTGNEFIFDFTNNDYAIFLRNNDEGTLLYKISGETVSGSGIYITPIDDSDKNVIKYIGNEILIDDNGRYISKETEIIYKK